MKRKNNRDLIISTAANLFHFNGYAGTGMDLLSETADVSKSNIYYHFKSKQDLLMAVMDRAVTLEEQLMGDITDRYSDPVDQIFAYLDDVYKYHRSLCQGGPFYPGGFLTNLASEQSGVNADIRLAVRECVLHQRRFFNLRLEEAIEQGLINDNVPSSGAAAEFLFAVMQGAEVLSKIKQDTRYLRNAIAQLRVFLVKA